ncbi:MAG: hypothetical protein JW801_17665 [Bacteroidales bacterium]|nr:hypothetical protein [Bacteroidales bacterium]
MLRYKFLVLLTFPYLFLCGQTAEKPPIKITVSGYIQHSMYVDTYKSTDTRDGIMLLYPNQQVLDSNGQDVNKNRQFQMMAIQSRPRISVSGPVVAGAEVSGLIEADFLGTSQNYIQMIRLRHAYLQMKWAKVRLLIGQYWHPMSTPTCLPSTIQHGAGAPFHPLNRSPQIRFRYDPLKNLSLLLSLHSAGYHKSSGPYDAARNAGIPEFQFNTEYNCPTFTLGIIAGYKFLKPRLTTDAGYQTDEIIGSYNLSAYGQLKLKSFSIKMQGLLGENISNYVMIGGYGAGEDPGMVDDYSYSNLVSYSAWTDLEYDFGKLVAGLFLAQTGNLGATGSYYPLSGYTRAANIRSLSRVSPRITLKLNPLSFSLEYGLTAARYGADTDPTGTPTNLESPVMNHRFLFVSRLTF